MTRELSEQAVTLFQSEVHHLFQSAGKDIRNTVRVKDAKGAKIVKFPVMGKGKMEERKSIHTPIPLANTSHDLKEATVKRYTISDLTDIFDNNEVPFDERQELAKSFNMALIRQLEQIIIDALDAATITNAVADTISGSADNLRFAAVVEAAKLLDTNEVPEGDRTFMCSVSGLHHMVMADTAAVASGDYNPMRVLTEGDLREYYGFTFKRIGSRAEGGLPVPASKHRTSFAYHKWAVGLAVNMEPKITVDWEAQYGAWRTTAYLSAGAVVIDPTGVVEITTDES